MIAWLLAAAAAQAPPQVPVFEARVETVYVDAFVTRGSTAATGLTAASFELLDEGRRQAIRVVDHAAVGLSAVLLLDVSGSMEGSKLRDLRTACEAFVAALGPRDQAAVLSVRADLELLVEPTGDHERLRAAIARLQAGGATALNDALYAGLRLGHGNRRPLVVAFSDGIDNLSWLDREQVLREAELSSALLYGVGLGKLLLPPGLQGPHEPQLPSGMTFMRRLAESTGGRFWLAERPQDLKDAFLRVLGEARERYLLAYEPSPAPRPGFHRLKVRLVGTSGEIRVRAGYRVPER